MNIEDTSTSSLICFQLILRKEISPLAEAQALSPCSLTNPPSRTGTILLTLPDLWLAQVWK